MDQADEYHPITEQEMRDLGSALVKRFQIGDVICLHGALGAGKTTLVRGVIASLGHQEIVRSPTFNLLQVFPTMPPILHADLYRVASAEGLGIEDYLDTHICFIEWPEHSGDLFNLEQTWNVEIAFEGEGRKVTIIPPQTR